MNANEHGFVLAKFQPPKGERIVECEDGEFILHCDHIQITKRLEENNLELARQNSALQLSQDNIINALGISGEGAHSKLVIEYVHGLVAENVALKAAFNPVDIPSEITDAFGDKAVIEHDSTGDNQGHSVSWSWVGNQEDVIKAVLSAVASRCETPVTDAFTAELRAQGAEEMFNMVEPAVRNFCNPEVTGFIIEELVSLAANLRAGRKG